MNQPPPHGWQQQPLPPQGWQQQQPLPPQGWQQQQPPGGWQRPQPGYGYPPQPPPKKSKAPIIIVMIVVGLLVLGGGLVALFVYLDANEDGGTSKRADQLPAVCGNISEAALAKARTTNPNGRGSSERDGSSGSRTTCAWSQTKGVDGSGKRTTNITVSSNLKDAQKEYDRLASQAKINLRRDTVQERQFDGLGDQATGVLRETTSAFTEIKIIVRKGDSVVEVDYTGWDAGIFNNKQPDFAEFEAAAKGMAEEMVAKL